MEGLKLIQHGREEGNKVAHESLKNQFESVTDAVTATQNPLWTSLLALAVSKQLHL